MQAEEMSDGLSLWSGLCYGKGRIPSLAISTVYMWQQQLIASVMGASPYPSYRTGCW